MAIFKRRFWPLLVVLALVLAIGGAVVWWRGPGTAATTPTPHGFRFVDDVGRTVEVKTPAHRVVVFNRYNAEFIRAIAGTAPIVGIDANTAKERAYWPELRDVAVVARASPHPITTR